MTDDMAKRIALTYINMKIMVTDVENAMRELTRNGSAVEFQAGMMIGLTAAKYALDGCTADEAWACIEPIMATLRKEAQA